MVDEINLSSKGTEGEKHRRFLPLLLEFKGRVYGFILTLVPRPAIAEDIMQETVLIMWEKFEEFEMGTNFYAWSKSIALNKIREYRRKDQNSHLFFDENVLEKINKNSDKDPSNSEVIKKLKKCLRELSKVESRILELRFTDDVSIKKIAQYWGKEPQFVYRQISKILFKLNHCIHNQSIVPEYPR